MRFKIQHIALLGTVLLATACTSQKNTFVNRLYHNTTAKYNAYFLALEKIREVEENIIAEYEEDYSQPLPVFYPIDSAVIEANNERLQQARDLASKAIDWHRISKWVDPSYYLLGKIDYYQGKFDEAQNTFKYLNVNSSQDEVRHLSLIGLLRSFIDLRKFDDAVYVMDYLSKESAVSSENRFLLYQTLAYYYESKGEVDMVAPALFRALEYAEERKEISRIHFILGQLYQQAGLDAFAYEYYQKSISGSPSYERTFFASLYSQQVAELSKSKDLRRVRGYYDDLYKDRKNIEFRDVILYEKAIFEHRQDEKEESIRLLTLAAKEPTDNRRQKGYIYEKLADIYLKDFNDFLTTKYYLDSALKQFREGDRNYQALAARKEVFDQYALNFELIQKNDSLISLSRLTFEEQEAYVDEFLRKEEERLLREAEIQRNKKTPSIFDNLLASAGGGSGTSFYWNNPTAMSQGALEFNRVWGGRPLTDNWRRSSRGFQETSNAEMPEDLGEGENESENQSISSAQAALNLPDRESLLATIPKDKAAVDRLIDEMEDAYFNLGKLLFFDLKEAERSIFYLEMLVRDYPMTVKKPEAYYTLYLAKRELGQNYTLYADLLNAEFPESQYTKSVNNPESVSGTQANFESSQNYAAAYKLYQKNQYAASKDLLRSTLENYPLTKNTDRLLMLDIMNTGKMGEMEEYRTKLENYLLNASDPALINLARKMLDGIGGGNTMDDSLAEAGQQIEEEAVRAENEPNAEPEGPLEEQIYKENKSQTHVFILAMEPRVANESKNLTADLEKFHTSNFPNDRLRTGTIALDRENTIVIISPFSNAEKALLYRTQFLNSFNTENLPEDSKISSFVISIENFQQLNRRKDLDEYRAFFRKSYNE
ncbi:type IX secretion system periplasmic lipoprotein PorW/SprE [Lunatimonas lonarensis]|uniref:type IX secretion system periplasmic lipoprotein PorW/SprE n=1 Tax=Lunatimonas lonarensis TaxID=1232681 RepID=UPI001EE3142F|nr:gliding motility protein [Lunatimonas lonarensis]